MIKKKQSLNSKFLKREYLFPRGRSAFFHAMQLLKLDKQNRILIPSYIGLSQKEGSGVFDPINHLKVGYEFYKLNSDLSVNIDDFTKKIKKKEIKAVLVIHYFGFCQKNFDKVMEICKNNNKYLIEDCAHAFNSFYKDKKLGTSGDAGFYSIHKFLSTDDGGILLINNDKIKVPETFKDKISEKAIRILYKSDIEKISQTRIGNFKYLFKKFKKVKGAYPFYNKCPEGIVPINFPIIIKNKERNTVYFKLLKKEIETVSLYHTLIPQIRKDDYPISHYISSHILNLPIHEDISKENINTILKELDNLL